MVKGQFPDASWFHVLVAEEIDGYAIAGIALFAGPASLQAMHYLRLGRLRNRAILPTAHYAHAYVYYNPVMSHSKHAGRIEPFRIPPLYQSSLIARFD